MTPLKCTGRAKTEKSAGEFSSRENKCNKHGDFGLNPDLRWAAELNLRYARIATFVSRSTVDTASCTTQMVALWMFDRRPDLRRELF